MRATLILAALLTATTAFGSANGFGVTVLVDQSK